MNQLLDLAGEKWRRDYRSSGISLFLYHSQIHGNDGRKIRGSIELDFFPEWLRAEDYGTVPFRDLHIDVSFDAPATGDWRSLAGLRIGGAGDEEEQEEEPIESWKFADARTPEEILKVASANQRPTRLHLEVTAWTAEGEKPTDCLDDNNFRDRLLTFGQWDSRDSFEIPLALEGLIISPFTEEVRYALLCEKIRGFVGLPTPRLEELKRLSKIGTAFRYSDVTRLDDIYCHVPVNTPDPIAYARHMAKEHLNLTDFYSCRINQRLPDGRPDPKHISEQGVLVILVTPQEPQNAHPWLPSRNPA